MNIPKKVYKYIEHELSHYEQYKKELELESELELKDDDMSQKSTGLLSLERTTEAIERALMKLTDKQKILFDEIYNKGRADIDNINRELNISKKTYARYKQSILYEAGHELGVLDARSKSCLNKK